MKLNKTRKIILYSTIMALVIVVFVLSQMILFSYHTSNDKILPGIYINDYYVGGMTKQEAKDAISNDLSAFLLNNNTKVINGDTEITIHASDVSNVDVDALVEKAYNTYREDNEKITYFDFMKMKFMPVNIRIETILDWQSIHDLIEMNQRMFYTPAVNAQLMDYSFVDNDLKITASPIQTGYQINVDETATIVQDALVSRSDLVYAVMDTIDPDITTESLLKMSDEPMTYSQAFPVSFDGAYSDAPYDLMKINKLTEPLLIMPGQSISIKDFIHFDEYNPSVYSIKRLHIPTIIYGCALQVGLTAYEHHASQYITTDMEMYPIGQEALIDDSKDLILTNSFSTPVILDLVYDSTGSTHRLICKIYYSESLEYTYIKSVIEEHNNKYYVMVYRVYANDTGGVLSRTLLEQHSYPVPPKPKEDEEEIVEDES